MVKLIRCKQQATGECEAYTVCSACGVELCECHGDKCVTDGHFEYQAAVYCVTCWEKKQGGAKSR